MFPAISFKEKRVRERVIKKFTNHEVNFYMDDTEIMETTSLLKKLTLYELSNLTRVWGKNSKGVLIFHVSNRKKAQQQM